MELYVVSIVNRTATTISPYLIPFTTLKDMYRYILQRLEKLDENELEIDGHQLMHGEFKNIYGFLGSSRDELALRSELKWVRNLVNIEVLVEDELEDLDNAGDVM